MTDRRTLLKAFAATPLLLAGCATRHSTTPQGVLNVGQISNSVAFLPLFIAEHKGYFAAEGVQLGERPRLGTGAKVAAALKGGSIDLGAGVITDAFNLAKIDDGTRIVTSLVTEYYVDVVVPPSFEEPDTLEDRIAALVGKRSASPVRAAAPRRSSTTCSAASAATPRPTRPWSTWAAPRRRRSGR
jgi:NitT/TauT family transport system substrate-binding protein